MREKHLWYCFMYMNFYAIKICVCVCVFFKKIQMDEQDTTKI